MNGKQTKNAPKRLLMKCSNGRTLLSCRLRYLMSYLDCVMSSAHSKLQDCPKMVLIQVYIEMRFGRDYFCWCKKKGKDKGCTF